jgi:hypothetical protein
MKYYTAQISFAANAVSSILKKISMVVIGGSSQVVNFFYSPDYSTNYYTGSDIIPPASEFYFNNAAYFNDTAYYGSGISISTLSLQAGGSGKVMQFGFECTINGYQISFQKLDVYIKTGKLA